MSFDLLRKQQNIAMGMLILVVLIGTFAYGLYWQKVDWLQALMVLFTLYAVALLVAPLVAKTKEFSRNDFYRPFVSIMIPAKNEEKVIESTITSIAKLQYFRNGKPNFEIIVIDDGSTDQTGVIARNCARKWDFVTVVSREVGIRSGKGAALNAGLEHARGEVIGVFDADTQVNPDFLLKSIPLLHVEEVAGIQGRVKLYNPDENFVTKLQNDEFLIFNHLTQKGKDILGGVTCLGGNGQLVKRNALLEVGGWNEDSLTEDFDLTLRLLLHGYQVRYAENAELWQEAVHTWKLLFRQRIRWGQGLLTSFFDFFLPILSAKMTPMQRIDGILTVTRILLPFWVIQGYFYQGISWLGHEMFKNALTPVLLGSFTVVFFVTMAWGLMKVTPCRWHQMLTRVIQYWFYAVVWVIVLPISYFNYFKSSRNVYWDKTHHKGFEPMATPASTSSVLS